MWETSEYWKQRAASAIRHAKYKELPAVRARRIKGLEKDERKFSKEIEDTTRQRAAWEKLGDDPKRETALALANICGSYNAWSDLEANRKTPAEVRAAVLANSAHYLERSGRWLAHTLNRLEYERAMLAESGGIETDKIKPEVGGGVKCWATHRGRETYSWVKKVNKVSVTVEDNWHNGNSQNFTRTIPFDKCSKVISRAEVERARAEGRLCETPDRTGFYIVSDNPPETPPKDKPENGGADPLTETPDGAAPFDAMRDTLRAGVKAVSAPQLFPTPPDLAARMVELADIEPGQRVLEPSAGTGAILRELDAFGDSCEVTAVEISHTLADALRARSHTKTKVLAEDFLECNGNLGQFDRIVMNPPFADGADIKHIRHAMTLIKPGGRIVAICANGPRQQAALKPLAEGSKGLWEELPEGTFAGTGVRAVLAVFNEGPEASR
jgi:protein-L-isoaspartate O-methyltransferase